MKQSLPTFLILLTLTAAFSTLTLWLIDSWIKYPLFVFEITLILALFFVLNSEHGFEIKIMVHKNGLPLNLIISAVFLLSTIVLLLFNLIHVNAGYIQLAISACVTSILPGYSLLRLFKLTRFFSALEVLILSFLFSYAFSGLSVFLLLSINAAFRADALLIFFLGLSLFLLVVEVLRKTSTEQANIGSFSKKMDFFVLALVSAGLLLFLSVLYPNFAFIPGMDTNTHYANSISLWQAPDLYQGFSYVLFHLHESSVIFTASASMASVQTLFALFNILMPLSFYVMAKSYLEKIDSRLPVVSTIFFTFFSGFAWIYLARLKLGVAQNSATSLLSVVNENAYNGGVYLAQPILWYVPLSVSFIILIIQLMLLRKSTLNRASYIGVFSILTIMSFLTHVTEAIIFTLFLCFLSLLPNLRKIRLNDSLLASLISFIFIDCLFFILSTLGKAIGFSISLCFAVTGAILVCYTIRLIAEKRISLRLNRVNLNFVYLGHGLSFALLFVYLLGLLTWLCGVPSFSTSTISDAGSIPWFIYPVFLGVVGLLGVCSLYLLCKDANLRNFVILFVLLLSFVFIFGRVLTVTKTNFFDLGYSEKRFTGYFYIGCAVLASITLVKVFDFFVKSKKKLARNLIGIFLVCLIIIYGIQSTFIVVETWSNASSATNKLADEFLAIDILKSAFSQDTHAFGLTLSSNSLLNYASPPYQPNPALALYTAQNPEIPTVFFNAHGLSHPYLFLSNSDYKLMNVYSDSWLSTHLLPSMQVMYANNAASIYNISTCSYPYSSSDTVLVFPYDQLIDSKQSWLYAFDVVSFGDIDFTVDNDLSTSLLSHKNIVISYDPPSSGILEQSYADAIFNQTFWSSISGTWTFMADGVIAGAGNTTQDCSLISPTYAKEFNETVTFQQLKCDTSNPNYVTLIYDWVDSSSFKYAGITFGTDGKLYVSISTVLNGIISTVPNWPGLYTGITWALGDHYSLGLSTRDNAVVLSLNGTDLLSGQGASGGLLGLRSTNFYKLLVTGFQVDAHKILETRPTSDYLTFVQNGGHLIVFNTNGYGYFSEQLFNFQGVSEVNSLNFTTNSPVELPTYLVVPNLLASQSNVTVLSNYQSDSYLTPFVAQENIGLGDITYVNVYPIVHAIQQNISSEEYGNILRNISNKLNLGLQYSSHVLPTIAGTFKQIQMVGNVVINSSSIFLDNANTFSQIQVQFMNGTLYTLSNLTDVVLSDYDNVLVTGNNVTLSGGLDFYSKLMIDGNCSLTTNSPCSITIFNLNESTAYLSEVSRITCTNGAFYLRQPALEVNGTTTFEELYSTGVLHQQTITDGQDLTVKGTVDLTIYLSDVYSWASSLTAVGSFTRSPPVLSYDEFSSIPEALLSSIVLLPVCVFVVLLVWKKTFYRN